MAIWFKSDISVYDRDDFQFACEECDCLDKVWEWIQRESIKKESGTIIIKNNFQLKAILKKLRISEAQFRDAQKLLGELELIIFDNSNEITLPNWLSNQGLYFAKKQAESVRKADYREKKKQDFKHDVLGTYSGQKEDIFSKSAIRGEEIREDKIRKEEKRESLSILKNKDIENFHKEIESIFISYGIKLLKKSESLELLSLASKRYNQQSIKESLHLVLSDSEINIKYFQPFGLINYLERIEALIKHKPKPSQVNKPFEAIKPLTEEERLKADEARQRLKDMMKEKELLKSI
jgi:hypothetical protein